MSEFWLVKSKEQLAERIAFFKKFLDEEWDWEQAVQWKVSRFIPKRSLSQNALFHLWCREMASHFAAKGADVTESKIKLLLKYKFLGTESIQINKTIIQDQVRETSGLNRGEMLFFMDQVQDWAMDHGVTLTCPADSEYMKLKGG
jgi:hypothetical protein